MCHLFWQIGQRGHFYLLFNPINTNLVEDIEILLPVKFRWIPFSGFRGKVKICLSQSEAIWSPYYFFDRLEKHKLRRGRWALGFCPVSLNSVQQFLRRSQNRLSQRPGWPSCFYDRPEKHKLSSGHWYLASCQVWLNSLQRFQRRSRKCLSQSEARATILFFRSAQNTQTW